jgi:hypothetical protein
MAKSSAQKLEERWFKKLNQPASGTYQLAHAYPTDPTTGKLERKRPTCSKR